MYESSHQIKQADEPEQSRNAIQIDEPGTFAEDVEEKELLQLMKKAGLDPQKLTSLPFDEAAELVSQSELNWDLLSDQRFVDYITSLMGRDVPG